MPDVAGRLRWEYLTLVRHMGSAGWSAAGTSHDSTAGISLAAVGGGSELSKLLNRLGSDGWELVVQIADELVLKRPVFV